MNTNVSTFFGKTSFWWGITVIGIVIALIGTWMLFYPVQGYIFLAEIFGWALLVTGIAEIAVSLSIEKKLPGWGWWLAGGIIDIIIGIILIADIALTELAIPYFFGFIFLFKGIENIIASFSIIRENKIWWLYLLNGILMIILAWMFLSSADNPAFVIDFLVSVLFIYWGVMLAVFSFDLKPDKTLK